MSNTSLLAQHVEAALRAGQSFATIRTNLAAAGWSKAQIEGALDDWAETGTQPPVPRPRAEFSVLDLFTYLALLTALAFAAFYMVTISLGLIDYAFDPPGESGWQVRALERSARWGLAVLIVAAPVYGLLVRWTDRDVRANPVKRNAGVRRFAIGLTLLIAAAVFAADLVYVVFSFLQGDVTIAFLLKALVVAVVALGLLAIGREDLSAAGGGLKRAILWAGAAATLGLIALTILALGSPRDARLAEQNRDTLADLTRIAGALHCPDRADVVLPKSLSREDMAAHCNGVRLRFNAAAAPDGAPPYRYTRMSDTAYTLCAEGLVIEGPVAQPDRGDGGRWFFNPATGCIEGNLR